MNLVNSAANTYFEMKLCLLWPYVGEKETSPTKQVE